MKKNILIIGFIMVISCDVFAERDEIGFAQALAKYGYFDHAGEIIQKARQNAQGQIPPSELERAKAAVLKSLAYEMTARRENPANITDAIDDAVAAYEGLVKTVAGNNAIISDTMELAELHGWKAAQAYKLYGSSTTAAAKDKWFAECESSYAKAMNHYETVVETLSGNAPFQDIDFNFKPYMMSRYNIISLLYSQSAIYPESDPNIRKLCEKALDCSVKFMWDYESYITTYYVRVIEAMCQYRLGRPEEAIPAMRSVFALESDAQLYNHPAAKDVITHAYRSKLEMLLKSAEKDPAQYGEVVKTVDALMGYVNMLVAEKSFPDFAGEYSIVMMRFDRAIAKYRLGDIRSAINEMADIAKINPMWNSYVGYRLSKPDITANSGSEPEILRGKIDGSMISADYNEAFKYCMYLARSKKLDDHTKKEYMPYIFRKIADIYAAKEQYYESAVALEMVYKTFSRRYRIAADAELYQAAMMFMKENALCESSYDQKRSEELLKRLAADYPASPYAEDSAFTRANIYENRNIWLEAAAEYAKVDRASDKYEEAFARIGNCYYQYFRKIEDSGSAEEKKKYLDDAIKAFSAYMDYAKKTPVYGTKENQKRQALVFSCKYTMAVIYIDNNVARCKDALDMLANADREYPDDGDKISRAWLKTIEAYLKMGDLDNAGALLDTAKQKYPAAPRLGYILKLTGSAFDQNGMNLIDKGDKQTGINRIIRGRNYLYNWFEIYSAKNEKIETRDMIALGDKLFIMAKEFITDPAGKKEQFSRSIGIYESALGKGGLDVRTESELKRKTGEANCHSGDYDKAKEIFENLLKKNGKDGAVMTMLIDVYAAIARNSQFPTTHPDFDKALDLCAQVLSGIDKDTKADLWWDLKVKQHEILLEQGKYQFAGSSLALLVNYNTSWKKLAVAGRITKLIAEFKKKNVWEVRGKK